MTFSKFARRTIFLAPADGMGASSAAGSSVDDIAASMIVQAPKAEQNPTDGQQSVPAPRSKRPADPAVVSNEPVDQRGAGIPDDDDDQDDPSLLDEDDEVEAQAGAQPNADDDEGDGGEADPLDFVFGDADHERDADDDDEPIDASKLGDDFTLSVTVDGEEREVTIGELKRRYAGEGAIEKRLQQVTETRKKVFEDYEKQTALATQVMQSFGQLLFRRTISPPNEQLLQTNPSAYIQRKEAYEQEGQALAAAQQQLHGMMQQLDSHMEEQRKSLRMAAAQELRRIMPAIADPVRGPKLTAALREAAREIGYSDADIAACTDPLMFKTMAFAARELRRMKGTTVQKQKENPRTLKASASKPQPAAQRRQNDAFKRAAKTGSIDDIAATMIQPAKRGRRT